MMGCGTLAIIGMIVVFFLLIKGVIQAFQRNPIVAILCVIFLFPIFLIWAFVEIIAGKPKDKVHHIAVKTED